MNPLDIFKMQKAYGEFAQEHPKFTQFLTYICTHPIEVGDVIAVSVDKGEGKGRVSSNLKVTEKDMELIHLLQSMGKKQ